MSTIKAFSSNNVFAKFGNNQLEYNELLKSTSKIKQDFFAFSEQVHGNNVIIVKQSDIDLNSGFKIFKNVDGLVIKEKNVFLVIKTADCIPILFFEPITGIIGVAHAGREGTRLNIVKSAIQKIVELGAKIDSILVEMGPAISQKHYEVTQKIFQQFVLEIGIPQKERKLDLKKVIISQLIKEGIPEKNIINHKICTFEDENYFSYRRDKTSRRQISFICLSESFQI